MRCHRAFLRDDEVNQHGGAPRQPRPRPHVEVVDGLGAHERELENGDIFLICISLKEENLSCLAVRVRVYASGDDEAPGGVYDPRAGWWGREVEPDGLYQTVRRGA